MKIAFSSAPRQRGGSLVLGLFEGETAGALADHDGVSPALVERALVSSRFTGRIGEHLDLSGREGGPFDRVILMGLGAREKYTALACEKVGGHLATHLNALGEKHACLAVRDGAVAAAEQGARMAFGARLASYRFHRYRTKLKPGETPTLEALDVILRDTGEAAARFAGLDALAKAICDARDLVNEPPNVLDPAAFAEACQSLAPLGVGVEIMDEAALEAKGFHALLAVGRGSAKESRLVVLTWNGGAKAQPPLAFVGKGVTFDTGGVSLKRAPGMDIMKFDMAGAAAVFGLMQVLAAQRTPVNAVGLLPLAENMLDGNSWRPGDIVRSLSGQTIEVLDTDAEGRMLLADALWYAVARFKPRLVVDIATLTGAVMAALNYQRGGLHANDEALAVQLLAAGDVEGERLWRLPLGDDYDALMDSRIADIRNSGPPGWGGGDGAGSTTAAQFLQRFVPGTRWAHLDIPGVAWAHKAGATQPEGPTGFGVRLLHRFVTDLAAET